MGDHLLTALDGDVLTVTFNRPEQRNAMTWEMYDALGAACDLADASARVMVLTGAGDSFVAGTDIAQFAGFSGADGVAYERRITSILRRLQDVDVPTLAVVDGACVGGGLALAASCDLRLASPRARFGVPIARTLGNCLSVETTALLVALAGPARAADLLLRGRLIAADEAERIGLVNAVSSGDPGDGLGELVSRYVDDLTSAAPLTQWASKETLRRLRRADLPSGEDIVEHVYGSEDFAAAVQAFLAKAKPRWTGR